MEEVSAPLVSPVCAGFVLGHEIPAVTTATTGATLLLYVSFNLITLFLLCTLACTKTTLQKASSKITSAQYCLLK